MPGVKKRERKNGEIGPPIKDIDFEDFEKCCQMQCTKEEIAGWFEIDEDTLDKRVTEHYNLPYSAVYKKYSANGKCSLRRRQFRRASNGDRVMMIWLGKQYLGQSEKIEQKVEQLDLSAIPDHEIEKLVRRYGKPKL